MLKFKTIILLTLLNGVVFCQKVPFEYNFLISKADSLYKFKNYLDAALTYNKAFATMGRKGLANDRYNSARSWAQAGYSDSAIFNMQKIVYGIAYSDYERVISDSSFKSLNNYSHWRLLIKKIKCNKDSLYALEAKWNKNLIALLDSLVKEDQKWRNLLTRFKNNQIPKDSIDPKIIIPNIGLSDNRNSVLVKRIFYTYGFPNYDLVGKNGSFNFWILVQHQDQCLEFQDSVLTALKIEVDRGKASWNNYAYLADRVKLDSGQKQIYGTQLQLNKNKTSYEPINVIEPKKLNERRKMAGLSTIENYIETTNRMYFGDLKH